MSNYEKVTAELAELTVKAVMAAMKTTDRGEHSARLGMALAASASALTGLHMVASEAGQKRPPNSDEMLFCALLAVACNEPTGNKTNPDGGIFCMTLTPENVADAFQMFEKLTGRSPKGLAEESLVRFAFPEVKIDPTQAETFAKFLPPVESTTKH